jgi:hypothetical protein
MHVNQAATLMESVRQFPNHVGRIEEVREAGRIKLR